MRRVRARDILCWLNLSSHVPMFLLVLVGTSAVRIRGCLACISNRMDGFEASISILIHVQGYIKDTIIWSSITKSIGHGSRD